MAANKHGLSGLLEADIYGITAEEYSLGRSNIEVAAYMIEAGIRVNKY
jgi:thiamine-phosphate pyrophosphorylase